MKKFMVVYKADGKTCASFFDDLEHAEEFRMNVECGVAGYAEIYRRSPKVGYRLVYC